MIFKIELQLQDSKSVLPINYQYPLHSWIYKIIHSADREFADFLHNTGYKLGENKTFKLFTFSEINFPYGKWKFIPNSDRILLWADRISFKIAFHVPDAGEKFIIGLFQNREGSIGDVISQIKFSVSKIERLKDNLSGSLPVKMRTVSPVVMSKLVKDRKHEQYIHPTDKDYQELLIKNLLDKYAAFSGFDKESIHDRFGNELKINVLANNIKRKKISIKAHTQNQVEVVAYKYEFTISATDEFLQLLLNSGLGSMNAMGFGMCEVVEG